MVLVLLPVRSVGAWWRAREKEWPMDEIVIRAACPEDAAEITEIATQPQVVRGTLQLPAQTVAGWRKRLERNDLSSSYVLAATQRTGVVACSTGNHAQAVALAAAVLGVSARIVMSPIRCCANLASLG